MHHDACWKFDRAAHQALCHSRWYVPDGSSYYTEVAAALADYSGGLTAESFIEFRHLLRVVQGQFGYSQHPLPPDHAERVAIAEAALAALRPYVLKPRRLYWKSDA